MKYRTASELCLLGRLAWKGGFQGISALSSLLSRNPWVPNQRPLLTAVSQGLGCWVREVNSC